MSDKDCSTSKMFGGDKNNKPFAARPIKTEYVQRIRAAYLKSFTTKKLKKFIPKVNDILERVVEIIESKRSSGPIDFQSLCVKLTLDTIGVIALERNNGGLDDTGTLYQRLIDFGHMIIIWSYNPFNNPYCFLFPNSNLAKSQRSVVDLLTAEWDKIADEILQRDPPSDGTEPLWYSIRSTINPDTNEPLERNLLRAELANVIVGGMDATGHQLGWILGLLSKHPEAQEKLYEEVKGLEMRTVDLESLAEMSYLSAVVKEGMRIGNVATGAFMTKKTASDTTLLGYRIPKNTPIFVPTNRWMDTEEDWGDPLAFRPERWTNNEVNPKNFYFGFSAGPRYCPGQLLALVEMKLALVKLVQNYIFTSDKEYMDMMTDTVNGFAIEAKGGMMLEVQPRGGIF